jgi:glycosyltransferase involved in cell wall biosynthesis
MTDLSVCIAARNEEFLPDTIEDVLKNSTADTEIIVVLDGYWPDPPLPDHPKVAIVHHTESIGQRAAVNEAVRISQAKFVMKLDAHCSVAKGFDTQLIKDCRRRNWTLIPTMWNLHAFDHKCVKCGKQYYQCDRPETCCGCEEFERVMVWKPRERRRTIAWRFDKDMHFQYWGEYSNRPEAKKKILETMCFIGACWFIHREQYWKLEGLDEATGSWGQVGVEVACKSWLSGGKLLTDRNTWFAHMFRTKNKTFGFPYKISGNDQNRAKKYSQDLWLNDRWPKAIYKLEWLVDRFKPVPGW